MAQLVGLVLADLDYYEQILDEWKRQGVTGFTVMESQGLGTLFENAMCMDDVPMFPSLSNLTREDETNQKFIFTIVHDDATADQLLTACETVLGDMTQPGKGLAFTLPLGRVVGLH